jgi:citronellol/citronellal dehydrogenase
LSGEVKSLKGRTLFITGASRGIGRAIALRAARDGARIAIVAKTTVDNPKLPGTIFSVAKEIEAVGGEALPVATDIRFEDQVQDAVRQTVERFGGIDILVNNASAIHLSRTEATEMKKFDLMFSVNVRATFMCSRLCLPHLKRSQNPHILMISPPPSLNAHWYAPHLAYTMSKMGMSLCVLGMAEELRAAKVAVNALWPKTAIATAAVMNLLGGEDVMKRCRRPEIVGDAAHEVIMADSQKITGQFLVDEDVLRAAGIVDFSHYSVSPDQGDLIPDFFLD